jgi:hypothetical protein
VKPFLQVTFVETVRVVVARVLSNAGSVYTSLAPALERDT